MMHPERAGSPDEGRIVATPDTLGGAPRLAGTRIESALIWHWVRRGTTVDALLTSYPHLTRADALAALAFEQGRRRRKRLPTE